MKKALKIYLPHLHKIRISVVLDKLKIGTIPYYMVLCGNKKLIVAKYKYFFMYYKHHNDMYGPTTMSLNQFLEEKIINNQTNDI